MSERHTPYCALSRPHEGPCLDGQLLALANALAGALNEYRYSRAEVEALLEAQREACAKRIRAEAIEDDRKYGANDPWHNGMDEAADDAVVRILHEKHSLEERWKAELEHANKWAERARKAEAELVKFKKKPKKGAKK